MEEKIAFFNSSWISRTATFLAAPASTAAAATPSPEGTTTSSYTSYFSSFWGF